MQLTEFKKGMPGQLTVENALNFMLAGNATFTLVDTVSMQRFTFRLKAPKYDRDHRPIKIEDTPMRFLGMLSDSNNEGRYSYIGYVKVENNSFSYTYGGTKAKVSKPNFAISLVEGTLAYLRIKSNKSLGVEPNEAQKAGMAAYENRKVEIFHAGKCGCCGRKLTVPESIADGIGPVCKGFMSKR